MKSKFCQTHEKYQKMYPNQQIIIDHSIKLTFDDICNQIKQQKYMSFYAQQKKRWQNIKDGQDWMMDDDRNHGVPAMNQVFYRMLKKQKHIPKWTEYLVTYKKKHCKYVEAGKMTFKDNSPRFQYTFQEYSMDYKLLKAYMSFLKEVYALFWFYDKSFIFPYYSFYMDLWGYDIIVRNMFNHLYGIRVYSNTDKALRFFEEKKNGRSSVPEESTGVSIIANVKDNRCTKIGDTYVFCDRLLYDVMSYINANIQSDIKFEERDYHHG